MDLIDRQAAIDAVLHHGEIENNYTDLYHDGYCDGVYDSADILKDLPSAEPKTGRWERVTNSDNGIDFRCSACYRYRFHNGEMRKKYKFCPNCGAKMEGSAEE